MAIAHCYTSWHVDPMGARALTFLDSAEAEFKRADSGHDYAEVAIFPATFLLRHGLECFAKQMTVYHAYEHQNASLLYAKTHCLGEIWPGAREYALKRARDSTFAGCGDRYGKQMWTEDAFVLLDAMIGAVDQLDPDGTQYRYPEVIWKDKVSKLRQLKYQFPQGDVDLTKWAELAGLLVQAADVLMSALHEEMEYVADSRGHVGVLFHTLVLKHYGDPVKAGC
ncbi:MAG: hypothetical protein RLZZ450_6972 [Pseudomonadota bacterium]|jgi:hypothetical protein